MYYIYRFLILYITKTCIEIVHTNITINEFTVGLDCWTYSKWETDIPGVVNNELQHADWINAEGEKSTENPLFTTAGKFSQWWRK